MPEIKTYGGLEHEAPMHIVKLFQLPSSLSWGILADLVAPGELRTTQLYLLLS